MLSHFTHPYFLFLLALVPLLILWYFRGFGKRGGTLQFSHLGFLKKVHKRSAIRARHTLFSLRIAVVILLIVALARPRGRMINEEIPVEAVDIVLAMDVSTSMLAEDIEPNRVEATKEVAKEFIKNRKVDRIGMVVFAGEAYTQCPLTSDYGILMTLLDQMHVGMIEDGTAIGMGLATAVNRLKDSEAKSKVIILLTDGRNNRGSIDPPTAAQAAQAFDIRIYTIGAGKHGVAMFPVNDMMGRHYIPRKVEIDETMLRKIADMTGGKYFRATDRRSLESIYREIDTMERTEIKVAESQEYPDLFYYLAYLAGALLLAEIVLAHTRFRKIP